MTPAIGLLYSGLLRRKSALSQVFLSIAGFAVVTVQWFLLGERASRAMFALILQATAWPFHRATRSSAG